MKTKLFNCMLLIIFGILNLYAQEKIDPTSDSSVAKGVDLILRQEYTRADSLFSEIAERYPDHPAGYLYRAAVMQAYALDFDIKIDREKFDSFIEKGKNAAGNMSSPLREYFMGTADGYEAYERVESGDWFTGIRKGLSSISEFEDLVEQDSTFYDAYAGIGTYYYWSSEKTEFLHWLPFVSDDRELGIKTLKIGAERSVYNRFAAISALISIFINSKDYQQAEEWSKRGLQFYPENRVFLWGLATAYDRQKKYAKAKFVYQKLLDNILQIRSPHPYNELVCRLNLVRARLATGDTVMNEENLLKILSYENIIFPEHLRERAQKKFDDARTMLSAIRSDKQVNK
ncbi:MAG: hypothetical protein JXA06_06650 [Bacteroidetes bacterium]|nr:hypothetical protein [Bacteroidota bacterium]